MLKTKGKIIFQEISFPPVGTIAAITARSVWQFMPGGGGVCRGRPPGCQFGAAI